MLAKQFGLKVVEKFSVLELRQYHSTTKSEWRKYSARLPFTIDLPSDRNVKSLPDSASEFQATYPEWFHELLPSENPAVCCQTNLDDALKIHQLYAV